MASGAASTTIARSKFEDNAPQVKFGARGTTLEAYKPSG
jgi:hypothetical protein